MRQTLVGVFDRYDDAQRAAQQLRSSGFADSVFVTEDTDGTTGSADSTTTGATSGSTTSSHGEGVMGHVRQFFSDLFGNDDDREVQPYAEAVRRGGALVKVEVAEERQMDAARSALESAGAIDIDERANEWRASGWSEGIDPVGATGATALGTAGAGAASSTTGAHTTAGGAMGTSGSTGLGAGATGSAAGLKAGTTTAKQDVLPVVKEELQVGKRTVGTGVVRVFSRTVERPVQESVNLRSEHAQVERRPVDRPASEAELNALKDRTIEVRETAEQPVVAKTARVVEEVSVSKTAEQHTEVIKDKVRDTEVEVRRSGETGMSAPGGTVNSSALGSTGGTAGATTNTLSTGGFTAGTPTTGGLTTGADAVGTTGTMDTMGTSGAPAAPTTTQGGVRSAIPGFETYDNDFRSDFKTRYGSTGDRYEEYEPAYRYGHSLAGDSRYTGQRWEDIEPHAQRDWSAKNPGSTWERTKAAVRHGWERVKS